WLIATGPASYAALVQYQYTGVIQSIEWLSPGPNADGSDILASYGIVIGAQASGAYTVDTSTPDFNASPDIGVYLLAADPVRYTFGGLTVDTGEGGNASGTSRMDVRVNTGVGDLWAVTSNLDFDAPEFNTSIFSLILQQSDGGVLDNDGLVQALPFDQFGPFGVPGGSTGAETILSVAGVGSVLVRAELTSHTLVPVPAAAWLFASALIGLSVFSRRRSA
ncbi:MAG: VPLPA-CTERM sorting domain-containing protein, partial [Pseudomonadota bacterium]